MKIALTIAGSDTSGGAGIQGDLKVFNSLGVYGTSVITSITAQNTKGVRKIETLCPEIVSEQIDALFSDIDISSVKTGMLGNSEIVKIIYEKLSELNVKNLVVDPVLVSTYGQKLLEENALLKLKKLISFSRITTPNISEAEALSGIKIRTEEDMLKASELIPCDYVVITGGENNGKDFVYLNGNTKVLKTTLKINEKIHGTGCTFSAAIAVYLAKGFDESTSIDKAKKFMNCALARNFQLGKSRGKGAKIADTGNLMIHKEFQNNEEKRNVVESLDKAINYLINSPDSYKLSPQVGINIAMALPLAKNLLDVAGISGRIVKDRYMLKPVGIITFNGSSHIGRVVLTAMNYEKEKRSAMNIRFSDKIIGICRDLEFCIGTFERDSQPEDTETMEWGTKEAIKKNHGKVPDIIYDRGGIGKEAMIRIIGKNPEEIVEKALMITKKI